MKITLKSLKLPVMEKNITNVIWSFDTVYLQLLYNLQLYFVVKDYHVKCILLLFYTFICK